MNASFFTSCLARCFHGFITGPHSDGFPCFLFGSFFINYCVLICMKLHLMVIKSDGPNTCFITTVLYLFPSWSAVLIFTQPNNFVFQMMHYMTRLYYAWLKEVFKPIFVFMNVFQLNHRRSHYLCKHIM